jgi:hypothetical protein
MVARLFYRLTRFLKLRSLCYCATGAAADGSPLFKYTWSPHYRGAQALFEQAQASYDPNAIAAVLQQAPFHLDSLMAMYDLYRWVITSSREDRIHGCMA